MGRATDIPSVNAAEQALDIVAEFRAPAWAPFPQTPWGSEFSAYTKAHVLSLPGYPQAFFPHAPTW
eukprot:8537314-Pyramimonas_sp.AAC.1